MVDKILNYEKIMRDKLKIISSNMRPKNQLKMKYK